MYAYDQTDHTILSERVAQFRDQTARYLAGKLSDAEFLPLRLQNGLYIQRLAPMLRVAVPYGLLSSRQLRKLAHISRHYDKGYGHLTTRQNIQFNWPELAEAPDILAELAEVEMHAIQTSGNCIRNVTSDHYAGAAADEIEDARPWCEIIRQWSSFHPEFAYLPRKFKIAVCGAAADQAATQVHDIGVYLVRGENGETGFRILAGGGLGRTPVIGEVMFEHVEKRHLLTALEAIMRVYNREGRRRQQVQGANQDPRAGNRSGKVSRQGPAGMAAHKEFGNDAHRGGNRALQVLLHQSGLRATAQCFRNAGSSIAQ